MFLQTEKFQAKDAFTMDFVREIAGAGEKEVTNGDHAQEFSRFGGVHDGKTSESVFGHEVHDGA